MKYVLLVLLVTHKVEYMVLPEYSFPTWADCAAFARWNNANQKSDSRYVYMCTERKK